jgi:predicted Ser/Thr protein kinase
MGMIESAAENDHVAVLRMALEEVALDFERASSAEMRSMLGRTLGMLTRDLRAAETAQKNMIKAKNEAESIMVEDELDVLRKQRGA